MHDSLHKYMKKYEQFLVRRIGASERIIAKQPEGSLRCNKCRGYYTWYRMSGDVGNRKREIIHKNKRKVAEALAYKAYTEQALAVYKRQLKAVKMFLKCFPKEAPGTGYLEICDEHKALMKSKLTKFSYTKEQLDWMLAEPANPHPTAAERNVDTVLGYKVRSKSESAYVSALVERGIVFRYEWPVYIKELGRYKYPDFTIIHPTTGETVYLEHFGQMDDGKYVDGNADKLKYYFLNGMYPGKNLFFSYESATEKFTPIDAACMIDMMFQM